MKNISVPVWEKITLTLEEASAYSGIGINSLRELCDEHRSDLVICIGRKRLIKRKALEKFVEKTYSI